MASNNPLSLFELPAPFVEPALAACRRFNTTLDGLFYDLPTLTAQLRAHGRDIVTALDHSPLPQQGAIDLDALHNPEGALLVVDVTKPPYIRSFHDVELFLASDAVDRAALQIASITGVGSSALGSAALAWNISTAFQQPVLAIVPGYGVADVVMQALGGWVGFGLHDFLHTKMWVQTALAAVAPRTASIGRQLSDSSRCSRHLPNGGPLYRTGSGSSDVLHDLMGELPLNTVVGHSKGALSIANALRSLDPCRTEGLRVVTLGCPVAEDVPGASYHQFLGLFDWLGRLNSWGHSADTMVAAGHTTNTAFPLSLHAQDLVKQ